MGGIFRFICHGWEPRCIVDLWCKLRKHADDDDGGRVNQNGWVKDVEVVAFNPFLGQLHFFYAQLGVICHHAKMQGVARTRCKRRKQDKDLKMAY